MSPRITLDYLTAQTAQKIVTQAQNTSSRKDIENLITQALGVLQAQGVYALYLYLFSKAEGKNPASWALIYLWNALRNTQVPIPLPEKVKIAPIQESPEVLFCNPQAVSKIRDEAKKQQEEARCRESVSNNRAFWGLAGNSEIQLDQLRPAREIILEGIRELTTDLDTLLLVRDLYEQTLIYARYHAKALGG